MQPLTRSRRPATLLLALLTALALALAACQQTPAEPRAAEPPAATVQPIATPEAVEPASPAASPAPSAASTAHPATLTTPDGAATLVGQAYRELTARLFREVRPAELFTAGWRGVRDEASRQGVGAGAVQPYSEAGSGDIDGFTRELRGFLAGPGADLDAERVAQAAIRGMAASVGDSHTRYLTPQQSELQDRDGDGSYAGIGVVTRQDSAPGLTINRVYAGSPAEQAGLHPGDRIVKVDGSDMSSRNQNEISSQIRGEPGTAVTLTVVDAGGASRDVTVNRARIVPPVISARLLDGGIGYLQVAGFPRRSSAVDAAAAVDAALAQLQSGGARAYVLDLRGNPGGDPTTSVDIASNFTQDGPIFVAVNRTGRRTVFQPNRQRTLVTAPVAVLIDGGSASGAEVVASALKEYEDGYLIGTRTCGCLSVGQPLRLDDQSEIIVTVQQALTGRYERSLEGVGLDPDEVVRPGRDPATDPALDRATEYLRSKLP
jgi:carboxyl-terminal processing protease